MGNSPLDAARATAADGYCPACGLSYLDGYLVLASNDAEVNQASIAAGKHVWDLEGGSSFGGGLRLSCREKEL